MKINLQIGWISILSALFIISACNDDPDPAVSGVLKADIDTVTSTLQYYYPNTDTEMGYEFMPSSNGIITHLGVKTGTAGQFQVRIFTNGWDPLFRNVAAQKAIDVTVAERITYVPIDNFEVKKDKKYIISVYLPAKSLFRRVGMLFPHNAGGVSILRFAGVTYSATNGTTSYLDKDAEDKPAPFVAGIPDFVFVKK